MGHEAIPDAMKHFDQWVVAGRNRIPLDPLSGRRASVTNPHTWASFDDALAACEEDDSLMLGFVLTKHDPFIIIDVDHKPHCPISGAMTKLVLKMLEELDTYAERSMSGMGLHIVAGWRDCPFTGRRKKNIEIYHSKRFIIITGDAWMNAGKINMDGADIIKRFMETVGMRPEPDGPIQYQAPGGADAEIIRRLSGDDKFDALYYDGRNILEEMARRGIEVSDHSMSAADIVLCELIAEQTTDPAQVGRIFLSSALARRPDRVGKTHGRPDYVQRTVAQAMKRVAWRKEQERNILKMILNAQKKAAG